MSNSLKSYSLKRAQEQIAAMSLKARIIAPGTVVRFVSLMTGEIEYGDGGEKPNDMFICSNESVGMPMKISMREYLKMKVQSGTHYETNGESIAFPDGFKIVSSKARTDRKDNVIYPLMAYKEYKSFLAKKGRMSWDDLLEAGMTENHGFEPVQDYTIELL